MNTNYRGSRPEFGPETTLRSEAGPARTVRGHGRNRMDATQKRPAPRAVNRVGPSGSENLGETPARMRQPQLAWGTPYRDHISGVIEERATTKTAKTPCLRGTPKSRPRARSDELGLVEENHFNKVARSGRGEPFGLPILATMDDWRGCVTARVLAIHESNPNGSRLFCDSGTGSLARAFHVPKPLETRGGARAIVS